MRYVRSLMGVGALLVSAGSVAAQPAVLPGLGPVTPMGPGAIGAATMAPPVGAPATLPPVGTPGGAPSAGSPPMKALSEMVDDHPIKDVTPHGGFGDLHPTEEGHHGHGEIPGYLTAVVPSHGGFYTNAEFLLMRPRNSDADYVIRSGNGLATSGPIDSLKYDIGTGFRIGTGYVTDSGKWEMGFQFTYFNGNGDSTVPAVPGQTLLPTLTRPGLTDRALTASSTLDLDYALYDIIAGRRFVIEDNLAVRALAGFRFADIRQTMNAFYNGNDARQAAVKTRSRFEGFGPLIGGEAVLSGPRGFHLYTRALGGFMSGRSSNSVLETNDNGATTYVNSRYDVQKEVPFGSLAIGGGWQYRSLALRAGYEISHWQGIFERPRFTDDVSQGKVITRPANLSLEGLFLQASLIY